MSNDTKVRCVSTEPFLSIVPGETYHVTGVTEARGGYTAYRLAEFDNDCIFRAYHFENIEEAV